MNIKKLLILAPVAVLSMTSCGKRNVRHEAKDYFVTARHARYDTDESGDSAASGMNILQLSDLHLGTNCDRKVQYAFIQKTIDEANKYIKNDQGAGKEKLDMIVITGDVFTFGTKEIAKDFVNFMEKQKIDWTMTFGNHDEQCYFSVDWLTGYLNSVSNNPDSYLLFRDHQDDDVFGNANFVIDVPSKQDESNTDEERLYIFDSNRYRYQIGSYGYDYIHHDQIDWYERCSRCNPLSEAETIEPSTRHSTAWFHIPFEEFDTYYKAAKNKESSKAEFVKEEISEKELSTQKEGVSCPKENTHLFDKIVSLASTKGVFVGHDHVNNSAVKCLDKNEVILSFGMKGTDTVYADDDMLGGQIVHISGTSTNKQINIRTITHKYSDLEVK